MRGMAAFWHGAGESKSDFEQVSPRALDRSAQISVVPEIENHEICPGGTFRAGFFVAPHATNPDTSMTTPSRPSGGKPFTRALLAALEESAPGANVPNLRRIVDNLIGKAVDGDLSAIKEVFDRIDGKAPTAAAGTGASTEEPKKVVFEWKGEQ
jgi:hypothetical protein